MFRRTVLLYESAGAQLAVDAIPAAKWAISRAIVQIRILLPVPVPLCAEVVVVSEVDIVVVAPALVSQPTVLQRATSAEAPITMLGTARHKP